MTVPINGVVAATINLSKTGKKAIAVDGVDTGDFMYLGYVGSFDYTNQTAYIMIRGFGNSAATTIPANNISLGVTYMNE